MKRAAGFVFGIVLAVASAGVTWAHADPGQPGQPGLDQACSHQNVAEKNKNCERDEGEGPGRSTGHGQPAPPNEAGPTTQDRATECAEDASSGNGCDVEDDDHDGVPNQFDNCPATANKDQADADDDGIGDECDPYRHDHDHDGVVDWRDNCPGDGNADQADQDNDGAGDACDPDKDGNGAPDDVEDAYAGADAVTTAAVRTAVDTAVGALPAP
jgi:hypothetical protein